MDETNTDSDSHSVTSTHSTSSISGKQKKYGSATEGAAKDSHTTPTSKPVALKKRPADDEGKMLSTPKRKKGEPADAVTPGVVTPGSSSGRKIAPLSERQQMALALAMSAQESGGTSPQHTLTQPLPVMATPRSAKLRKVNKRNEKGESPLHLATIKGDVEGMKRLLKAGADVNVQDFAGWTALHEACNHGFVNAARLLLRTGATVNAQGLDNDTPLHDAAINGHPELVALLLKYGANPSQCNRLGKSALDVALNDDIRKLLRGEHTYKLISDDSDTALSSPGSMSPKTEDSVPNLEQPPQSPVSALQTEPHAGSTSDSISHTHEQEKKPVEEHSEVKPPEAGGHLKDVLPISSGPVPELLEAVSNVEPLLPVMVAEQESVKEPLQLNIPAKYYGGKSAAEESVTKQSEVVKPLSSPSLSSSPSNSRPSSTGFIQECDKFGAMDVPVQLEPSTISEPEATTSVAPTVSTLIPAALTANSREQEYSEKPSMKNQDEKAELTSVPEKIEAMDSIQTANQSGGVSVSSVLHSQRAGEQSPEEQKTARQSLDFGGLDVSDSGTHNTTVTSSSDSLTTTTSATTLPSHTDAIAPDSVSLSESKETIAPIADIPMDTTPIENPSVDDVLHTEPECLIEKNLPAVLEPEAVQPEKAPEEPMEIEEKKSDFNKQEAIRSELKLCSPATDFPTTESVTPTPVDIISEQEAKEAAKLSPPTAEPPGPSLPSTVESMDDSSLEATKSLPLSLSEKVTTKGERRKSSPIEQIKGEKVESRSASPLLEKSRRTRAGSMNNKKGRQNQPAPVTPEPPLTAEADNSKDSTDSQMSTLSSTSSTRASRSRNKASTAIATSQEKGEEDLQPPVRETRRKAQQKERANNNSTSQTTTEKQSKQVSPKVPPLMIKLGGKSQPGVPGGKEAAGSGSQSGGGDQPSVLFSEKESEKANIALNKDNVDKTTEEANPVESKDKESSLTTSTMSSSTTTTTSMTTTTGVTTRGRTLRSHASKNPGLVPDKIEEHVPPRKSKRMKAEPQPAPPSQPVNYNPTPGPTTIFNPYSLFMDIRDEMCKKWAKIINAQPRAPVGYSDFSINTKKYLLTKNSSTNASKLAIPLLAAPAQLSGPMKELFNKQEQERYKLRQRHLIEGEKLRIAYEQEIVRVYARGARAQANQETPLSVCSVLKDKESGSVYHPFNALKESPSAEEKNLAERVNARTHFNNRQLRSWLQDTEDKFERLKDQMISRHHHEAESLYAVQMMNWEWNMRDCAGQCDTKSQPKVDALHVPIVIVNDDADILNSYS